MDSSRGIVGLGNLEAANEAFAASMDGSVVVGQGGIQLPEGATMQYAFRWTSSTAWSSTLMAQWMYQVTVRSLLEQIPPWRKHAVR